MRAVFAEDTGNRAFIDLLRSIGILQVVLFHVVHGIIRFAPADSITGIVERTPFWLNFAWQAYGVDVLFIVSAFLLTWSLLLELKDTGRISIRGYYIRRLSRILPLYYIAVVLFALAQGNSWQEILTSALFIGYIVSDSNVIPVGWSMEVMILYYLILPWIILALTHMGRPILWLTVLVLLSAAWRYFYLLAQPVDPKSLFVTMLETKDALPAFFELYFRPWFRVPAFLMGTLFAYLLANDRIPKSTITPILSAVLIIPILWVPVQDATSLFYLAADWVWVAYWALAPILFARAFGFFMVWGLLRGQEIAWKIPNWARGFSTNIFAVYLFHMPMLAVGAVIVFLTTDPSALGDAKWWHIISVFAVTSGATHMIAWPITRFLERPIQNWIRRRIQ